MSDDHELRVFDEAPLRGRDANVEAWLHDGALHTWQLVTDTAEHRRKFGLEATTQPQH